MKSTDTATLHDYPPEAYALLSESEKTHFWFRGRNTVISRVIRTSWPDFADKTFLEAGCGTGYVLAELAKMGCRVTGLDMHAQGLVYAKKRVPNARFVVGSIANYHPKTLYDAVGMFDVLEHIPEDVEALRQCATLLKKDGMLFLSVPARPELWSVYDDISGHKRRYTNVSLTKTLAAGGFRIRYMSYFGFFQYIPHLIMKRLVLDSSSGKRKDVMSVLQKVVWQPPGLLNWLLEKSFTLDMMIAKITPLPLGTSLIVSAQKAV